MTGHNFAKSLEYIFCHNCPIQLRNAYFNVCILCGDDGLMLERNKNDQQIDQLRKRIIKMFKDIGFMTGIDTNLKIVDFFSLRFSLNYGTCKQYKTPMADFFSSTETQNIPYTH